jgi:purine nucleosidase
MNRTPLLLDCDTGIDDAIAIMWLLSSRRVDLVAITTGVGNVTPEQSADNTLRLLEHLGGPPVPVAIGASATLVGEHDGGSSSVHGVNGIGDVVLPPSGRTVEDLRAAEYIVRAARQKQGRLEIVCTGAMTNLALALALEPRLPALVARVTVMGGAVRVPGNVTPAAEANVLRDPEAAQLVFTAGFDVTIVPLDVTMDHVLEEDDRQLLLRSDRLAARTAGAMLEPYFGFYTSTYGRTCSPYHDVLAVAIAVGDARPAEAHELEVVVDTAHGPGRGQTIADLRDRFLGHPPRPQANCRVVFSLDEPFTPTLLDRLLQFSVQAGAAGG